MCVAVFIDNIKILQSVEAKCSIRSCIKTPTCLGPPPSIDDWGCVPSIDQLGVYSRSQNVGLLIHAYMLHRYKSSFTRIRNLKIHSIFPS